jgi:hypothetical protein
MRWSCLDIAATSFRRARTALSISSISARSDEDGGVIPTATVLVPGLTPPVPVPPLPVPPVPVPPVPVPPESTPTATVLVPGLTPPEPLSSKALPNCRRISISTVGDLTRSIESPKRSRISVMIRFCCVDDVPRAMTSTLLRAANLRHGRPSASPR